jgi:hypothetical protein
MRLPVTPVSARQAKTENASSRQAVARKTVRVAEGICIPRAIFMADRMYQKNHS